MDYGKNADDVIIKINFLIFSSRISSSRQLAGAGGRRQKNHPLSLPDKSLSRFKKFTRII
jgi:hypothetical protein